MISNSFRVLVDTDGKRYRFDRFAFNEALGAAKRTAKERDQMLSREFFQAFADALATSVSTITHWASGYNGPSDMERVKDMAEFLGVDYKDLLLAEEQEDAMSENGMMAYVHKGTDESRALYFEIAKYIDEYVSFHYGYTITGDASMDMEERENLCNRVNHMISQLQKLEYKISMNTRKQLFALLTDILKIQSIF